MEVHIRNFKVIWWTAVVVLLATTPRFAWCASEPMSAKELIEAVTASWLATQTIEGRFATYVPASRVPGCELGPDGLGLLSEFHWGSDRTTGKQYIQGRWGFRDPKTKQFHYQKLHYAYDGSALRGRGGNSGEIRPDVGTTFVEWASPLVLIGDPLTGETPPRSLAEVLGQMDSPVVRHESSLLVIHGRMPRNGLRSLDLVAWIDPDRSFLPVKIQTSRIDTGTVKRLIEVDQTLEISPGIWIPTRGRISDFSTEVKLPTRRTRQQYTEELEQKLPPEIAKMSREQRRALSVDQKQAIVRQLGLQFEAKPLGLGTRTIIVEPQSLHVNEPIADEKFSLEFPPGALIWNGFEQRSQRIPSVPVTSTPQRRIGPLLLVILNLVVLVLVVIAAMLWRRRTLKH